jgi:hypothetical protein
MARTLLGEVLGFRPDFIKPQFAHAVRDPLGRAYNRTSHLGVSSVSVRIVTTRLLSFFLGESFRPRFALL